MKKVLVKYVEIVDSKNPKQPDPTNIAEELENRVNQIEVANNAELFEADFVGEDFKPISGTPHDIRFSIPYDKVWKFVLFFRQN